VAAMDVFDSSGLAGKLSEKLLRSYIITAIADGYKLPLETRLSRQTVSVNCERAGIAEVATHLSRELGVSIDVDEDVRAEVTLVLEDVDGVAAIRALTESASLVAVLNDGGLRLMQRGEHHEVNEDPASAQREGSSRTFANPENPLRVTSGVQFRLG